MKTSTDTHLARFAGILSLSEIFWGSFVHALRIPLGGHFLSLLQISLLCELDLRTRLSEGTRFFPLLTSSIAATLKSLSPAGKKLTPMLAIGMQGFLYNLGTFSLGRNLLGSLLGTIGASLWGIGQPLFLAYFFLGTSMFEGLAKLVLEIEKFFPMAGTYALTAVLVFAGIKVCIALIAIALLHRLKWEDREFFINTLESKIVAHSQTQRAQPVQVKRRFRLKVVHLFYFFSILLTVLTFALSQAPQAQRIWLLLRPLALYMVFWILLHLRPIKFWTAKISFLFPSLGQKINLTLSWIHSKNGPDIEAAEPKH